MKDKISNQITKVIIEAFKDFARLSPADNSSSVENDNYFRYFSGTEDPFFNGMWWHSFDQPIEKAIAQSNSYFDNFSYVWWLDEKTHTQLSQDKSFTDEFSSPGSFLAMARTLENYELKPSVDPDVTIEEIKDASNYEQWINLLISIFDLPKADSHIFKQTLNDYGPNKPYTHFLAKYKNKSAGIISLYSYKNIAYICNGAVLEGFRKKGIGTSLGKMCMEKAIDLKAQMACSILMASREAKGMCERLGFSDNFHIFPYIHNKKQ